MKPGMSKTTQKSMILQRVFKRFATNILHWHADYKGVALYPPGHYYSPLITPAQVLENEIGCLDPDGLLWRHVSLQPDVQENILKKMARVPLLEFPNEKTDDWRYYSRNGYFGYGSATILVGMMQIHQPKRIVEVGSGFSSAVMLDAAQRCDWDIEFTFIEPYPDRLKSLLRPTDHAKVQIIEQPIQKVGIELFQQLEANDLLFIDSSHVIKPGSELADLFFRVIPSLKRGCLVHFHDIFYPEVYPRDWLLQGISWNETFLLRAFLLFNECFKVIFFNPFARREFKEMFEAWDGRVAASEMSSMWIQRVA